MSTDRTPTETASAYADAWVAGDADTLRDLLADDCTFRGPLATAEGAEDCVAGLTGMARILESIEVHHRWVDGDDHEADVLTWFDLHTSVAAPTPTANWSHVVDGRITRIQVAFDPRELTS